MDFLIVLQGKLSFLWEVGVPFLVALTILVFVHEFGHYIVARWCGVRVEVFSIGFGKEIKGWTDKRGTRWKIAFIPLGGYVKMFGESESIEEVDGESVVERPLTEEERDVSFFHKSLAKRASIVVAGPLINFLFAAVAFFALYLAIGVPSPVNKSPLAVVGSVASGSVASRSDLRRGDQIISINGTRISLFEDLQKVVRSNPNVLMTFRISRGEDILTKSIAPKSRREFLEDGSFINIGFLGITADPGEVIYKRQSILSAAWLGIYRTYVMTERILRFIGEIFVGRQSTDELGGILRIAQISGQVAELGIASYISFLAILSINLGLINLFPIPLLDGGHLVFYLFESIRGRPLGEKAQEYSLKIGLALVLAIFVFVTWNDLVHLRFFEFITEYFG